MRTMTDQEILDDVLTIFKNGYPSANLELERHLITRWFDDPYSLGAYSYRGPFADVAVETGFGDPLNEAQGRIRFGGEYMAGMDFGCAHGAYKTGVRAASEFIPVLQSEAGIGSGWVVTGIVAGILLLVLCIWKLIKMMRKKDDDYVASTDRE